MDLVCWEEVAVMDLVCWEEVAVMDLVCWEEIAVWRAGVDLVGSGQIHPAKMGVEGMDMPCSLYSV